MRGGLRARWKRQRRRSVAKGQQRSGKCRRRDTKGDGKVLKVGEDAYKNDWEALKGPTDALNGHGEALNGDYKVVKGD